MIIDWNLREVKEHIDKIAFAERDARMDGFVTWKCKQELYEILWYVEDKLEECSNYSGEEDFVKAREFRKMWAILKGDK